MRATPVCLRHRGSPHPCPKAWPVLPPSVVVTGALPGADFVVVVELLWTPGEAPGIGSSAMTWLLVDVFDVSWPAASVVVLLLALCFAPTPRSHGLALAEGARQQASRDDLRDEGDAA